MKNYYKIFNIKPDATEEEIKHVYHSLAKRYHPDINPNNAEAAKRFKDITEAYNILSDPQKREEYDRQLQQEEYQQHILRQQQDRQQQDRQQQEIFYTNDPQIAAQIQVFYSQGYQKGYLDAYAKSTAETQNNNIKLKNQMDELLQENNRLKTMIDKMRTERNAFEEDVSVSNIIIEEEDNYIAELENRIQWLKKAINIDANQNSTPLTKKAQSLQDKVEQLKREIEEHALDPTEVIENITTLPQQERRKQIREELIRISTKIKNLTDELADINAIIDNKRQLADSESLIRHMEEQSEQWAEKLRRDRKLAKNTLYGVLNVPIWATVKELDKAYDRLTKRYSGADEHSQEMLNKVKIAYSTLINPRSRAEYDLSIGFTEEMIAAERKLINDIEAMQADYHKKLEARIFWDRFDDLSALALFGNADAQNALGEIYYKGTNIGCNYKHAVYWFREAFEQGYPAAIYNLGVCYYNGQGVSKDRSIAKSLFRQATNLNYTPPPRSPA